MATLRHPDLAGGLKADSQLAGTCSAAERKVARCPFTIESILGLGRKEKTTCAVAPHRPWAEMLNVAASPGTSCPISSEGYCHLPGGGKVDQGGDGARWCGHREDLFSPPNCCWFRGRRPRTAFTRRQIEVLEEEFRQNCYPGIDVREELARKLALDEDRIQIWFQNRRAKLKRSHRESQFLMVKNALISSDVQRQKPGARL
ncbi:homeobox expressed in ES cells 1 [Amblyraja radiata]|uniref:homeobox expressed in ES cells 1 n=1 Tax=Amblyraja radiata TaxID=386614 RepID=UPI001402F718|nr:homeobox expressed in ES cells 1 [Amblyraja radiata]